MKPIKFDLPINGIKVRNLEELRDNFTTEILDLHASGLLLKWLESRKLAAEAEKLSAIPADKSDVDRLVSICTVFGVEADRQVINVALAKAAQSGGQSLCLGTEELKYKEKYEKLSELLEQLKRKKLYLSESDYNQFVKDKLEIEHDGTVVVIKCTGETNYNWMFAERIFEERITYGLSVGKGLYDMYDTKLLNVGDIVEVGDVIRCINDTCSGTFRYVSQYRGVVVELGDIIEERGYPRVYDGQMVFCIQIDHDTNPTLKVVR